VNPGGEATPSRVAQYVQLQSEIRSFNAGMTKEYSVDGEMVIGGLASSGFGGVVTGVQIPRRAAYLASRELVRSLMITSLVLLLCSALVAIVLSRLMTRPLERLSAAARVLGQGRFDIKVDAGSRDEIGLLGNSFNQMARELKRRDQALADAQKAVIQSEKMAAFGQLGAGIAHEVKNPLAGILGVAQLSLMSAEKGSDSENNLRLIEKETRRCKEIIENLLKFARQEKSERKPIQIQSVIDDACGLLRHQLEVHQVSLKQEVDETLPAIMGNANQLQQVLVNLVMNAQQAMDKNEGIVKITAHRRNDHITVVVADNGPGIPPDIQEKIFDPFFTTKRGKKGTGLGLSVTYGIVRDHQGTIKVESEVGSGALFVMTFPIAEEHDRQLAA
jgi:signal transduction histidine kinase